MLSYPILSYPTTDAELRFERKEKMFRVEKSKEILQDKWKVTQLSYLHHCKYPGFANLDSSVNQPPSWIFLQPTDADKQANKQTDWPKKKAEPVHSTTTAVSVSPILVFTIFSASRGPIDSSRHHRRETEPFARSSSPKLRLAAPKLNTVSMSTDWLRRCDILKPIEPLLLRLLEVG